jgi:hypothetical protein
LAFDRQVQALPRLPEEEVAQVEVYLSQPMPGSKTPYTAKMKHTDE